MSFRPQLRSLVATLEFLKGPPIQQTSFVTMEAIAFQTDDKFGAELEVIVSQYKDLVDSKASHKVIKSAVDLRAKLVSTIQRRLGIKIKLITDQVLAAVIPNVYVPQNPVVQDSYRGFYEVYLSGKENPLTRVKDTKNLGTVNTATAKVTGWFSEQEVPVFINFIELFKDFGMSVPEVTGIILHELGHVFKAIVFSSNVNTTNQVLADIARHIEEKHKDADVNYIYSKLKTVDKSATIDLAEALVSGNRVVMSVATYRIINGISKSLMAESTYDKTTFESLADNFATRFGYGASLVTGLEKLEDEFSEYDLNDMLYSNSIAAMILCGTMSIIYGITTILLLSKGVIIGGLLTGLFSAFMGFITYAVFNTNRVSKKDMTYDDIKTRYTRIRNTLVEQIKSDDIPVVTQKVILEQIKIIDEIIPMKKVFDNPISKLTMKIFSSDRQAHQSIEMQKQLESLISNDIFLASRNLSLLGSKA